jgi:hypothetical protein
MANVYKSVGLAGAAVLSFLACGGPDPGVSSSAGDKVGKAAQAIDEEVGADSFSTPVPVGCVFKSPLVQGGQGGDPAPYPWPADGIYCNTPVGAAGAGGAGGSGSATCDAIYEQCMNMPGTDKPKCCQDKCWCEVGEGLRSPWSLNSCTSACVRARPTPTPTPGASSQGYDSADDGSGDPGSDPVPQPPEPEPRADPPPEPDPGSTNTCGSQGFYEQGDYDSCVNDCGECTRKQDCGGLPCEGGYCWRCGG